MDITINKKKIKNFGYLVSITLLLLSLYLTVQNYDFSLWYLAASIVTLTITFFYHNIFKYPAIFWYKIGNVFHKFLSPIILFIVYIFSIVLVGMMMKIFRKDSLNRKINYKVDSYWLKSKDKDIHNCNLNDQF